MTVLLLYKIFVQYVGFIFFFIRTVNSYDQHARWARAIFFCPRVKAPNRSHLRTNISPKKTTKFAALTSTDLFLPMPLKYSLWLSPILPS